MPRINDYEVTVTVRMKVVGPVTYGSSRCLNPLRRLPFCCSGSTGRNEDEGPV